MMNNKTKTNRILSKKHNGTFDYVKRFSMCNCVTVYFPETYTAHAMTIDFFLKLAQAGVKLPTEHTDLWPSGYVKVFKIPNRIDTFIFSVFNEAYHPNYVFESRVRYAIGPHEGAKPLKNLGKKIRRKTLDEFSNDLLLLTNKVDKLWDTPTKILIEYDKTYAKKHVCQRMVQYEQCARETLNWPVISIKARAPIKDVWCHYSTTTQEHAYKDMVSIEKGSL